VELVPKTGCCSPMHQTQQELLLKYSAKETNSEV